MYIIGTVSNSLQPSFDQFSGALFRSEEDFSAQYRMYLPPGCGAIKRFGAGDNFGNRQYIVGMFNSNVMIDEDFRAVRQGIPPPDNLPAVATGGGATPQIAYWRFYDEVTGERSSLGGGFSFTGDLNRVWTNFPTYVPNELVFIEGTATIAGGTVTGTATSNFGVIRPGDRIADSAVPTRWMQVRGVTGQTAMTIDDSTLAAGPGITLLCKPVSRVSHVELWLSVSGALPRFVMRVRMGTTSVTESTPTLSLGEAFITSYEPMPVGEFGIFYNDRFLIAGVEGHRDTVFLSAIGFPERYEGLSFKTAYNEPIVGMFRYRDYVVLLCPNSSYRLQGYTEDDYVRTVLEAKIGGIGHHCNVITGEVAIVPSREYGIQLFNGAFHPIMPQRFVEWTDLYLANKSAWENGMATSNPNDQTYHFLPDINDQLLQHPTANGRAGVFVGDYGFVSPNAGGSVTGPEWLADSNSTPDDSQAPDGIVDYLRYAAYLVPAGTKAGKFYYADYIGNIWEDDTLGVVEYHGNSIVVPGHQLFGDFGGQKDEGKRLTRLWSYVKSEESPWVLEVWPGDEYAYPPLVLSFGSPSNITAGYTDEVDASYKTGTTSFGVPTIFAEKTVHEHIVDGHPVSGRGFSFAYTFQTPLNVVFMGLGGEYVPGVVSRGAKDREPPP